MTQNKSKKQNFLHGAAILTLGVIIMKILGAIYKIPLGNILQPEGYALFISSYSIYNIFFTLATAGLPVALSRLIAEADANGRGNQEVKTFKVALCTFSVIGIIFSTVMFFCADWLAENYLELPAAALSIKAMSPAILMVCIVSAYRGFCQGNGNMIPTTVDEVLEVLFKVISGLILAVVVLKATNDLAKGSAAAILGVSIGGLVSLAFMIIYKRINYDKLSAGYTSGIAEGDIIEDNYEVDSAGKIVKDILTIGIPIALGASIMAILNSIDPKLCMNRLVKGAEMSHESAKYLYGCYGEVQTLFNLPAALTQPLNISVVPAIAGALAVGRKSVSEKVSEDSLRITAVVALPMGLGLACLSTPIVALMFKDNEAGGEILRIMGFASFFVCMVLMENAILQASGKERLPMYSMISGSFVKIIVNYFLIADPDINIVGAPVGTLCGYVWMAAMNFFFIRKTLGLKIRIEKILLKPVICSAAMGAAALIVYAMMSKVLDTSVWIFLAVSTVAAIGAAVIVYLVLIIAVKTITMEDMKLIPGGEKIGKLLHIH